MRRPHIIGLSGGDLPRMARRSLMRLIGAAPFVAPTGKFVNGTTDRAVSPNAVPPPTDVDAFWQRAFRGQRIWGYADRHSVLAGGRFSVMASVHPDGPALDGRIQILRSGHYPNGRKHVWTSKQVRITHQPVSLTAACAGASWNPTVDDIDTTNWDAGCYFVDFVEVGTEARDSYIAQIIVRRPASGGHVLLKLSTNTYQAYNSWGGVSLYPSEPLQRRGTMVSFDRPTPPDFLEYDAYLLRWIDALARDSEFVIDYASNFDVHHEPDLIGRYDLVICGAHDEYWSKEEFDAFERRIFQQGRNTIFFGANTAYWQVRYADIDRPLNGPDWGRQMVTYKGFSDPIVRRAPDLDPILLATSQFRDRYRRPETMLLGAAYQNWFVPDDLGNPRVAYFVENTDEPFFAGTGYKHGDFAADVVGYEWDNRDPEGDGRRLWSGEVSRNALLAQDRIKVLFRGSPRAFDGTSGVAEAVYFVSPAGAKVFNAGSVRWIWGLGKPGFEQVSFQRFNRNLVLYFLGRAL